VRGGGAGLNGSEDVAFLVREAAPKLKEAPGPTYGERGGVRWLGIDGAVENRGGATAMAYWRKAAVGARTKCTGECPFYSCEHQDRRDGSGWRLVLDRARIA
jgi:hypothetical protein